jgi:cytochrome b involved in lipid metabolism
MGNAHLSRNNAGACRLTPRKGAETEARDGLLSFIQNTTTSNEFPSTAVTLGPPTSNLKILPQQRSEPATATMPKTLEAPSKTFTRAEVKKHKTGDELWFIIDAVVYDVSDFLDAHPGGEAVLRQVAGTDATTAFYNLHRHEVLVKYAPQLALGRVEGEEPSIVTPAPGDLSLVPYAEPLWLSPPFKAPPYFKESHRKLRRAIREFVDAEILPEALEKEKSGEFISQKLIDRMSQEGILHMRMGPGKHLHGKTLLGGAVDGKEFDYFHDMIIGQELVRTGTRGFMDGNMSGMVIGLTAVLQFCRNKEMKERIAGEVLSGKKKICLAISEAFAGSDVANLMTTATKTPDGKHYIVNGTKKWITNGVFCDYFVTGVKTDKGLSVLFIERGEGVETMPVKTSYSPAAGTAFITFDNVKVPVENLLGQENKGIYVILSNFNHERWTMACKLIGIRDGLTGWN